MCIKFNGFPIQFHRNKFHLWKPGSERPRNTASTSTTSSVQATRNSFSLCHLEEKCFAVICIWDLCKLCYEYMITSVFPAHQDLMAKGEKARGNWGRMAQWVTKGRNSGMGRFGPPMYWHTCPQLGIFLCFYVSLLLIFFSKVIRSELMESLKYKNFNREF